MSRTRKPTPPLAGGYDASTGTLVYPSGRTVDLSHLSPRPRDYLEACWCDRHGCAPVRDPEVEARSEASDLLRQVPAHQLGRVLDFLRVAVSLRERDASDTRTTATH